MRKAYVRSEHKPNCIGKRWNCYEDWICMLVSHYFYYSNMVCFLICDFRNNSIKKSVS